MRKGLTEIVLVLDRSGSMESIKDDAEGGLRDFVRAQRKAHGEARLTFYRFDYHPELVFEERDIRRVEDYDLRLEPRGSTALIDTMCEAIDAVGRRLAVRHEYERPENVVFVTVTDGQENASRRFGSEDLRARIDRQRKQYNWNFIFIGCDESAIQTAIINWGYSLDNVLLNNRSGRSYRSTYYAMASNVTNMRAGAGAKALNFTDEQRAQVLDDNSNDNQTAGSGGTTAK